MATFDQKHDIVLKFLNKILVNIGKSEIAQLEQFVGIDREDIIKEENKAIVKEMEEEFFGPFDKKMVDYYRRNKFKHYILTLLRKMIADIGYNFLSVGKKVQSQKNVEHIQIYSVVKINKQC